MDIKTQIQQLVKELGGKFGNPTTSVEIQEMELKLNLKFPKEYKEFLQTFGWINAAQEIFGGGKDIPRWLSAIQETLELREMHQDAFPMNCVAVHADGFGNYYCIVCDGKDVGKVIFWQHDVDIREIYPNTPPDEENDFWIEGPDFWTWLLEMLQGTKKSFNEYEKERK